MSDDTRYLPPNVVTVGEATVKRRPDEAYLSVSIETRDRDAAKARSMNADGMASMQATLHSLLPSDTVKTTSYTLVPEVDYKNGRGTVRGYIARNELEVRIDDLNRIGEVIDAVNSSRGTTISISGLRFALRDRVTAEAEALTSAVQAAHKRAGAAALGVGKSLGRVIRIEEQSIGGIGRGDQIIMRSAMAAEAETPITVGDIEIRARVVLTVEIREE